MAPQKEVEWVGALISLPSYVTGEGAPHRPEVLLWIGADGAVLGATVGKPGEPLASAGAGLREAIERPMWGRPHAATRVRVATEELAAALREAHPRLAVVCAATPEADGVLAALRAKMEEGGHTEQSYLSPDVGADAMASFFRAAAHLFRAKPWKIVPSGEDLISVTIEELGIRDHVLSVIGQLGRSRALVLFTNIDDFDAYLDAAFAIERGEEPAMPPHFALNFDRGSDLSDTLRKEIAEHQWEVAAADAYPWLVAVDADLVARPPTSDEVTMAEAIARALPAILSAKKALAAAWKGRAPLTRSVSVGTYAGDIEVTLQVPYARQAAHSEPPHDVLAALRGLERSGDEIDPVARHQLEDELVRRFADSPEAEPLSDIQFCHLVLDFAADYFVTTIARLGPRELREIVFEIIPRKVSIDASAARALIEENRAFYAYLKREHGLKQADACLRVLGGDAVKKLEAALSDPSRFGMAKSLFMAGRVAGFDMESQAGIEAWMRAMEGSPLPASIPRSSRNDTAARTKRKRRRAVRKARRGNR